MAKLLPRAAACVLLALASVAAPAADVYVEPDAPAVARAAAGAPPRGPGAGAPELAADRRGRAWEVSITRA